MSSTSERLIGGPRTGGSYIPTASQSVRVESDDRVEGVRLHAIADDAASATEDARLLLKFSPDFIAFPDATARVAPPFKEGRNDYHPRPAEAFIDGAHPYVATPGGPLAWLYVAAVATLVSGIGALLLLLAVARFEEMDILLWVLAIGAAGALAVWVILYRAAPGSTSRLRQQVAGGRDTSRLGIRRASLDLPDSIWAQRSWDDYLRRVVRSKRYPRTTYGRVVPAGDDRYLQYWQFYVFNDWHNRHEADWELVVIRVSRAAHGWTPRAAAYSSHFGGHWRTWDDIETRDRTHPVVYVAKGSHAQYFESRPDGYRATLTQPLELLELRIRLIVQNDWTDVVAAATGAERLPYVLRVIPTDLDATSLRPAEVGDWWWLAFDGLWGARDAIPGPASQGLRWTDPLAWVRLSVDREVDDLEAFAVPEGRA